MAHESCSFCEQLPATSKRGWGGSPSKCPVCKQDLWTSGQGGTYRLIEGVAPARRSPWFAVVGAFVGVVLAALGLWAGLGFGRNEPTPVIALAGIENQPIVAINTGRDLAPTERDMPKVRAKPGHGDLRARAKPARVIQPAHASVKPVPVLYGDEGPREKRRLWLNVGLPDVGDLKAQLLAAPEVDLDPQFLKRSKKDIAKKAEDIAKVNKTDKNGHDAFVRQLKKDRADLAGLPFLLGKDCELSMPKAAHLATNSRAIREALGEAQKQYTRSPRESHSQSAAFYFYTRAYYSSRRADPTEALPALKQILLAEEPDFRQGLIVQVANLHNAKATELLANRAVFDTDADVRNAALTTLLERRVRAEAGKKKGERPNDDARATFMKGLRYPWRPAARNAAHAVAILDMKEMIPDLVKMLDEPAPGAPYEIRENGKSKWMVRELVRINHHRNCMLCHAAVDVNDRKAASQIGRGIPVGPVPSAQEPLPPTASPVYYSVRSGVTVVRADITYLRQDFSLQQKVENSGKWPALQRFDFLVRTRELTKEEAEASGAGVAGYREMIALTLRRLTGLDAPANAASWRAALGAPDRIEGNTRK